MLGAVSTSDVIVAAISAVGAILAAVLPPVLERQRRHTPTTQLGTQPPTWQGRRVWALVAVMSLLVAILSGRQIYQALSSGPVEATVAAPTAGEPIRGNRYDGLEAYVKNIPEGFKPTISVYDPGSNKYNPSDKFCAIRKKGLLDCPDIYVGKNTRFVSDFTIQIIAIDRQAQTVFSNYNMTAVKLNYPGLTTLPAGTLIIKEIPVSRTE